MGRRHFLQPYLDLMQSFDAPARLYEHHGGLREPNIKSPGAVVFTHIAGLKTRAPFALAHALCHVLDILCVCFRWYTCWDRWLQLGRDNSQHRVARHRDTCSVHRPCQELLHTSVHTPHRLREAFCELSGSDQFPQLYVCRQHVPVEGQVSTAPPAIH